MKEGPRSLYRKGSSLQPQACNGRKEARISLLDFQDAIYNGCSNHLHYNSICNMHNSILQMGACSFEASGSTS